MAFVVVCARGLFYLGTTWLRYYVKNDSIVLVIASYLARDHFNNKIVFIVWEGRLNKKSDGLNSF